MVEKVCLASDIIIGLLRKNEEARALVESADADFFTTSINIFELWYGKRKNEVFD